MIGLLSVLDIAECFHFAFPLSCSWLENKLNRLGKTLFAL
uniref:Uncharacterized protein n=1 Tax=Rhizophora mucronata TaxID=61149 RepID=A0A2P2PE61_RHIMU